MEDFLAEPESSRTAGGSGTGPRLAALAVLAMGIVLLVAGAMELWVGLKAERVADLVRPEMTDAGLARHRKDFESARNTVAGLTNEVLPSLARSLGVPTERLRGQIDAGYPAVAKLLAEQDQIVSFAEQSLSNLERRQRDFHHADALPVRSVPGYTGGVVDLALALGVIACGATLLRAHGGRAKTALAGLAVASAVLVVVPLILQVPSKAASAQTVLDSLNPSTAVVARTETSLATAQAASAELNQRLLPDLAAAIGVSPPALQAAIAREFPQVGAGLQELPAVLGRYQDRAAIRSGGAPDLRTLKNVPVGALGWFGPAYGLVLGTITGWAALFARRSGKEQGPPLGQ
jgi:hypothetical protein